MNDTKLQSVDLNLLVVLDALLEYGTTVKAAEQLGRTQSSVSHALGRLRETFEDALLVRVGNEMRPTEHALRLREPLRRVLGEVKSMLTTPATFDPATYERTFKVITTDFGEVAVIPRVLEALREVAPGVHIDVINAFDDTDFLVRDGRVDMALGTNFRDLSGLYTSTIFHERFVCVLPRDHVAADGLDLDAYMASDHILVTPRGLPGGIADDLLKAQGRSRRVVLRTPHFLSAGYMVTKTGGILTIPSRVAELVADTFDLALCACPLDMPTFRFSMIYSEVWRANAPHQWFRELLIGLNE